MLKNKEVKKAFNVSIDSDLHKTLKTYCANHQVKVKEVVNIALKSYLGVKKVLILEVWDYYNKLLAEDKETLSVGALALVHIKREDIINDPIRYAAEFKEVIEEYERAE